MTLLLEAVLHSVNSHFTKSKYSSPYNYYVITSPTRPERILLAIEDRKHMCFREWVSTALFKCIFKSLKTQEFSTAQCLQDKHLIILVRELQAIQNLIEFVLCLSFSTLHSLFHIFFNTNDSFGFPFYQQCLNILSFLSSLSAYKIL